MIFWTITLAWAGIFLQPFGHLVRHQAFQRLAHFGTDQLVLGLRREFGIGQLDRHDRGQPFAHILAGQRHLLLLQHARFIGIIVEGAGQRRAECGQMGAAVALRDVVGEAQHIFVIAVIPFQRDVDGPIRRGCRKSRSAPASAALLRSRYLTKAAMPPS
jgi:hypothetical protein